MTQTYSDEVKAQILGDFALGMSKSAIARKHGIPRTTVITIIGSHEAPVPTVTDTQKRETLGQLVYDYLDAGLRTLISQAREVGAPEYIQAQSADKLYLLHGTLADKLIALFGAIERGNPDAELTEAEDVP